MSYPSNAENIALRLQQTTVKSMLTALGASNINNELYWMYDNYVYFTRAKFNELCYKFNTRTIGLIEWLRITARKSTVVKDWDGVSFHTYREWMAAEGKFHKTILLAYNDGSKTLSDVETKLSAWNVWIDSQRELLWGYDYDLHFDKNGLTTYSKALDYIQGCYGMKSLLEEIVSNAEVWQADPSTQRYSIKRF